MPNIRVVADRVYAEIVERVRREKERAGHAY
jgi:hypothetical protein